MSGTAKIVISSIIILISIALGIYVAFNSIALGSHMSSSVTSGSWWTNTVVGSVHADARTRAYVAKIGLLALAPEETTYYPLYDVDGEPISSDFVYELRGNQIPARWWSITLYGEDHFLVPNKENRYSVKSTQIEREVGGGFVVYLSREPHKGNWISLGNAQNMSLSLRMYNPPPDIRQRLDKLDLPTIHKIGKAL
ncbi:MAG: DUF1214 domain-containing protein [Gammaproteobacteria bacterium]|nr:DUF1214 domain-containing protein [Gammaproteobacteria bacterium]